MNTAQLTAPLGVGAVLNGIAYYCDTIPDFLKTKSIDVLKRLLNAAPEEDYNPEQEYAWKEEIRCLQARLSELKADGYVVFEYNIVRMAKRIDVVLLLRNVVYSLEFKIGQKYTVANIEQALDYAFRLRNFHKMSQDMYICPVLIATDESKAFYNPCIDEKTIGLQKTSDKKLLDIIKRIDAAYGSDDAFDFNKWFFSDYRPTPNIVEAAVDAFNSVPVASIARSEAGQEGIDSCVSSVNEIINYAKLNKKKCICFVTGVPGAGKTLVGLDIAAQHSDPKDDQYSVYISGNGPLVDVLQDALARTWRNSGKATSISDGQRKASALIQDAYVFRNTYLNTPNSPYENVLIFDEAQRAWSREQVDNYYLKRKNGDPNALPGASEAELILRFMNRHDDWAVIICLVGLGQDIHNGESGIFVWFDALLKNHRDWEAFYSPSLFGNNITDQTERDAITHFPGAHERKGLHLAVSVRSFRAEKVSSFINDLVENNPNDAKRTFSEIKEKYPVFVTRDLQVAKEWATKKKVGTERLGLIASSNADDASANGVAIPGRFFKWPDWFLEDDSSKPVSSNSLAFAASEFNIQGLEIDWAIMCWGADFRYEKGEFDSYVLRKRQREAVWEKTLDSQFRNSTPQEKARWIRNAYRVNLTRARQGMIIYVPRGSDDPFSPNYHEFYDGTFEYLTKQIGIPVLEEKDLPKSSRSKMMSGPTEELIQKKLEQLKTYFEKGLIDQEEYKSKKSAVLDNLLY